MHTYTKTTVALVAIALLAPLVALSTLPASIMEKHKAAQNLEDILSEAQSIQNSGSGLMWEKTQAMRRRDKAKEELEALQLRKSKARRRLALVLRQIEVLEEKYNVDLSTEEGLAVVEQQEKEDMGRFVAYLHTSAPKKEVGIDVLRNLFTKTLGQITQRSMLKSAAMEARMQSVSSVLMLKRLQEQEIALRDDYVSTLKNYQDGWEQYQRAQESYDAAQARIAQVQRITREVEGEILRLQRELARIDAQLVARLERELIEKGLMSPQPGERSDGRIRSKQTFQWPVTGRISAGYYNKAYEAFFGVPHKAIDIVVPQGSRVGVAADGVVYLARYGGAKGYSYVLVGHRNGYATLYGHLSSIAVSAGDELSAGHTVGYSGGTPGTVGAGPMTTGAHLHFEVIRNGEHVDPMSVLP